MARETRYACKGRPGRRDRAGGSAMKNLLKNRDGSVLILVAASLLVLLGFAALGVEAGRWYLVRAELSKSVDAGALAGAKNISNPHVDPERLAEEISAANFQSGYLGTVGSGAGAVAFKAHLLDGDKVKVDGHTNALPILAGLFGVEDVPVSSVGAARQKEVEIMLVLDRSHSLVGQPIADLQTAARSFVDYFQDTQDRDRVGLITFATSVTVVRPLGSNFVSQMDAAIDNMVALGATNAEDAIDQVDGPSGLADQSGFEPARRVPQFLIFFSDGRPTAFRGSFKYQNANVDAVGCVTGNCEPWDIGNGVVTYNMLGKPGVEDWLAIDPRTTGDGVYPNSACGAGKKTVRWNMFDRYPVPGYAPGACSIPYRTTLASHVCNLAANLALMHGQELKDKGVIIYTIGLGNVNQDFLGQLGSSPETVFYTPSSDQLEGIFQKIAKQIRLRLVM
jgi:uncharacterized protein YegL